MTRNTPDFEDFWAQYPVHKDRKRAEQAWQRLTAGDRRAAIAALPGYIADCQQNGIQYKYAQGWLNGRRWEDEADPSPALPCMGGNKMTHPASNSDYAPPSQGGDGGWSVPPDGLELW